MKSSKFYAAAVVAVVLLLSASTSYASTFWISPTNTPTAGDLQNPIINVNPGQNFTIYLYMQMSAGQSFTGFGHDLKMTTTGVVTRGPAANDTVANSYTVENPNNGVGTRWTTAGKGVAAPGATMLFDNANFVNSNGSPLGFASPPTNDPTYNAATTSYLIGSVNLNAVGLAGSSTTLFYGVGTSGITWKNSPGGANLAAGTTINFGFGDAAIAGNDSRRNVGTGGTANSTVADATINIVAVPEPSTLVLIGLGLVGLVGLVRRRKSA